MNFSMLLNSVTVASGSIPDKEIIVGFPRLSQSSELFPLNVVFVYFERDNSLYGFYYYERHLILLNNDSLATPYRNDPSSPLHNLPSPWPARIIALFSECCARGGVASWS